MHNSEESRPGHSVHTIVRHHGHGMLDQKRDKGMRNPITGSVPMVDPGGASGVDGAGYPGLPEDTYGGTDQTGS